MTAYLLKRLGIGIATLLVASMVVFAVLEILPGDPAQLMLGFNATPEALAALHKQMGLDQPLAVALPQLDRRHADARFRPLLHLFRAGHRPGRASASSYRCRSP